MSDKRYKFFFSQKQREYYDQVDRTTFPRIERTVHYALLDNGELVDYTEAHSIDLNEKKYAKIHRKKYSDSVYLGEGLIIYLDGILARLERDFNN